MKIVVLSRGSHLYSTQSLLRAGRRRGHTMIVVDHMYCDLVNKNGKIQILYDGRSVRGVSAIIPRIGASATSYGAIVIRQFMHRGVFSAVSPDALLTSRNKFAALQVLAFNGIPVPLSILSAKSYQLGRLFEEIEGPPYIIKLLNSTHGLGVLKGDDIQHTKQLIEAFSNMKQRFLIQEFIQESKGIDIRVFVVGNKVVAAMKRVALEGEFRSNLHRGGNGYIAELSAEEERVAIESSRLMGLHIAGVDILRTNSGPLVLEVNASPGLEGIETVTGIDIAGEILRYIEHKLKHKRPF